jgi:hypothetical protein
MKTCRIILVCALLTASCGDPPAKTPSNSPGNANPNNIISPNNSANNGSGALDDFEERLWSAVCQAVYNCPDVNPELAMAVGRYASEMECRTAGDFPGLNFENSQLEEAIDNGRIRYDAALADQCFRELEEDLCGGGGIFGTGSSETCDAVVTGLVPEGGNCADDQECADNRDCAGQGDGEMCYGTCQPNCGENNCTTDEFCADGECQPRLSEGANCNFDECQAGLYCGPDRVCTAPGSVGEGGECNGGRDCADGLSCTDGTCSTITRRNQGETCSFGEQVTEMCQAGFVCTNLRVEEQALVGTCGLPRQMGEACNLDFECAAGLACDSTSPLEEGTCVTAAATGEMCQDDLDCLSFNCSDGTCTEDEEEPICMVP